MEKLHVRIIQHNVSMNFPCDLCGDYHHQDYAAALLLPEGKDDPKDSYGDVCPACLDSGPEGAAVHLIDQAKYLEKKARSLRRLAKDVKAIPQSDWKTADDLRAESQNEYEARLVAFEELGDESSRKVVLSDVEIPF
jgi:hypothetical protein